MAVRFLTASEAIRLNERVLGRPGALIDEGKLTGGLRRAEQIAHYQGAGNIPVLAAYVVAGIALAHAFADGNKRTALAASNLFLLHNRHDIGTDTCYDDLAEQIERFVATQGSRENVFRELISVFDRCIIVV